MNNETQKYNDVVNETGYKLVRPKAVRATLSDINAHGGLATAEADDPTEAERLEMNKPTWDEGKYTPGADTVFEYFFDEENEEDKDILREMVLALDSERDDDIRLAG